jgi:quinol-cytochrome oxidoreductase complex cytochrome b subunit
MSHLQVLSSLLYTLIVGAIFVFIFIFIHDLLYGEKPEKQQKKIQKYFKNETIKKIEMVERQPRKFTIYQVKTDKETKRLKLKPGYKVVRLVPKKK